MHRPSVRLEIFGGFRLSVDGTPGPALPRKTRALLTYLALSRGRSAGRETVGELLWTDRGGPQVQHSLRQALTELRRLYRGVPLVQAFDARLALDGGVIDDATLLQAAAGSGDPAALAAAAAHYAGPLLDGFGPVSREFDEWLALARASHENAALALLARLADRATERGDLGGALAACERMYALDPLREDTHRRLLQAFAAGGRRTDALRHYAAITEALKRDLGVAPARETRELAQRLRHELDPAASPEPIAAAPTAHSGFGPPLAVLPFRTPGDAALPSHLTEGLVSDIVYQLAGLRELSVISHGTTIGLRDPALDPRAVGRLLNVRYVVRGAIRRDGNAVRIGVELVDAESGMVVWARSNDTGPALSFVEQDRVVAQIVNTLAPRVRELELRRIRGRRPGSLGVYDKVLLAREQMLTLERESFARARTLLDEVMLAEPGYGEGSALAADWHGLSMTQGWLEDRAGAIAAVERLTREALRLDPDNIRALVFYGHRKSLLHRDYSAALELFGHALSVCPSSAQGWLWSSYTYAYLGDTDEALRRAARALELSPRDRQAHDFYSAFCVAHYTAGDYAAAADWGIRALGEASVLRATYRWTAAALVAMGATAQARDIARQGLERMPNQTVDSVIAQSPYQSADQRERYGRHLRAAGFPG